MSEAIMAKEKHSSSQSSKERNPGRPWYGRIRWLFALGSILMSLSWVFQYKFATDANAERSQLEQSQTIVDISELRMDQWEILYLQEKSKKDPDQTILLVAAFKELQSLYNLMSDASARVRSDDAQIANDIAVKNQAQVEIADLYAAGNLVALESYLQKSATVANYTGPKFNNAFSHKYFEVLEHEQRMTWTFLTLFILGSLLIGVDYVRRDKDGSATQL
jgi:hypothetical protein